MLIRPGDLVDTGSTARVVREMVDTFITEVSQDRLTCTRKAHSWIAG